MQIPKSMTVAAAEDMLDALDAAHGPALPLVPTTANHMAAGGEGAFVQALATWASRTIPAALATWIPDGQDVQVQRLAARLYGLASILLADSVRGLRGVEMTPELTVAARARLQGLQSARPSPFSRGPQCEVLAVDHIGRGAPLAFYERDPHGLVCVKRLPAFNAFTRYALSSVVSAEMWRMLSPGLVRAIGSALHELFNNTDEHARVDERGDAPRKSIRGFQARRHEIAPDALDALAAESPPLADYCGRLRPARARNRNVQLVEIAVFDCGPGLGPSLTGSPAAELNRAEEREAVVGCFGRHVSRKRLSAAGLGLPNVVAALRAQNGFLRVRTGRQALYADLGAERARGFGDAPDLRDWFADREAAPAVGTLFTLMFPLED